MSGAAAGFGYGFPVWDLGLQVLELGFEAFRLSLLCVPSFFFLGLGPRVKRERVSIFEIYAGGEGCFFG